MLDYGRRILYVHIWECVCATLVANEQRVALRVVASVLGTLSHTHQTAIAVLAATCRDTLRHDARTGVATDVNHLCTRICLLEVVGHRHRVELRHAVVAREDTTRIFPRDCRAGFDLRPRQACVVALADTALGHKVVDTTLALLVAWVPILYGRIFHLGIFQYDDLDNGCVQLILIALRSGATFEVAHVRTFVGHDQRSLKLTRSCRIDTEVGAQLHRATHALRDIAERSVRKDSCVQRREEVVGIGHHATQVLAHQFGIVAYGLADRAEDDSLLGQHLLEGCLDRNRVHHRIDRHARQRHLLFERNTQLVERTTQFGVDFVH